MSTSSVTKPEQQHDAGLKILRHRGVSPYLWVWAGVILIYLVMLAMVPNQASVAGMAATLPYIGLLGFAAAGQALVVMQRGIDFSVVGAILLSGMVVGNLTSAGWGLIPAVLVTILLGIAIGLVNGLVVVYLRLTPLVATLATNGIYIGLSLILSRGAPVRVSQELNHFARGSLFGFSSIFLIAVAFVALLVVLLNRTVIGGRFIATGSNPLTAQAAGIPVNRYILVGYATAGLCYATTGILLAAHIGDSRMTSGGDYLMASIAAVVLGGTPLTGGRGSMVATFGGAIFMTLLAQMVLALGAPKAMQLLVQAIVLVAAITLPNAVSIVRQRVEARRLASRAMVTSRGYAEGG